ncbi:hypothetical protein F0562_020860 [Nyssa sinensis]|uniref:DNA polymerase V n=1 Tax=Nyssa sinensis TaxID=561372 RepID=A0A5J5BRW5_9ASTE|nr:hypothetical protein F0562_020860 [Nyssa sinensis]
MRKEKRKGEVVDGSAVPSTTPHSVKPMERKKKRKSLDKERHHTASDNAETKPNQMGLELKVDDTQVLTTTSPSCRLPEFHISVFKDLASADGTEREAAVEALVTELQEVQRAYDNLEKKELVEGGLKLEAEKDDGLNNCAPSLRYAVRRLIRGVSSSRECARQGFALGLTLLVGAIPSIKVDSLLKLVVDLLEVSSSMKGQEVKDCLLGRLFAYGALARSGRLAEEWISDKSSPYIKEFVSAVISLAAKKRYLQEPAVSVILDLIEKLPIEAVLNQVLEAPGLQVWFEGATEVGNPDALLLGLKMRERISVDSKIFSNLLPYPYSPTRLFADDHLPSLVNCLKESTFCQPRVHSVWPVLVNNLLPDVVLQDVDSSLGHASDEPSDQSQTTDDNSEIGSIEDKDSGVTLGTSDFLKSWVVDSLPSVLKHLQLDPEAKFRVQKEILKFLAVQGLFSSSLGTEVTSFELQEKFRWPKAATSSALCRMCIEQLQLLLANAQKGEGPHAVASGLEANDLGSYFMRFLSTLCNIPSVSLFRALSNEDEKAFKKLQAIENQLSREERNCGLSTDANKLHALRKLLPLPDLLDSSGEDEPDGDGMPALMDVLVDTLLSLLPQSSAPMRSSIEQVFKYFCDGVTDDGLLRMLRVIKKDLKPARHQELDSEDHDDDDQEDLLGIEEAEESDEAETGETGESDEQTDDSEAVGVEAVGKEIPEASDDSDDSDGGMDDDAMFRMDSYLAQDFQRTFTYMRMQVSPSGFLIFSIVFWWPYFDSKKSQMKSEFLKEIFRRRPWIGHHLFAFLLEKCASSKSEFRRVEALELVIEIFKSLISVSTDESGQVASKKILKTHLLKVCHLIKELVTNMPEKQSRRAEVRKFCGRVFQILTSLNMTASFLKALESDAHAACESQLGEMFLALKKLEH